MIKFLYEKNEWGRIPYGAEPSIVHPARRWSRWLYENASSGFLLHRLKSRRSSLHSIFTEVVVLVRLGIALGLLWWMGPGEDVLFVVTVVLIYDVTIVYLSRLLDRRVSSGGPRELGTSPARNLLMAGANICTYTLLFAGLFEYRDGHLSAGEALITSWSAFTTADLNGHIDGASVIAGIEVAIALFMLAVVLAFVVAGYEPAGNDERR